MSNSSVGGSSLVQLLHHVAGAVLNRYGNEGREVVREAVYKFGYNQGKQIRGRVEALGLEADLENFLRYNGIYEQNAFLVERHKDDGLLSYEVRHWPLEDQAIDAKKVELGLLLCELDRALLQGYNQHLSIEHSSCIRLGSHSCHFVSKVHSA
ncbi:MAG: L-2-amino-thiazoline-4-carboxylic acid hydrolase [Clostridia bacterium]|nr:L-2-amino-thiazoline-4-carboxylic acid hydrolase [Clostridia bacterium]